MKFFTARFATLFTKENGKPFPVRKPKTVPEQSSLLPEKSVTLVPAASSRAETLYLRVMIMAALVLLILFIRLFFYERNTGVYYLYVLLCISLGYKLIKVLFECYHYWAICIPVAPGRQFSFTADVLTTAMPGEPYEMIEQTLKAMVNIRYPHTNYLCDEGNDDQLKELCKSLGVIHVTRQQKVNAKAGNINNALRQATGDICVILDPDHTPTPQLLDEVLPYFSDPEIGFVQVPQMYKNAPDTWIAQSAAQQTYSFYGPLMKGMNSYGTVQAIGANCSFRRKALDSIGGHAAGLSEDMHTAMRLHAKGWKSVYTPAILTKGLVPANIEAYYKQQLKWSRGTFELLFTVFPVLFSRLSWRQRLHYLLLPLHFAAGIIVLIDILIPIIALITGEVPVFFNTNGLLWLFIPVLCSIFLVRQYAQRWLMERHERGFHFSGGILLFGTWWVYTVGFIYTLFRVKVPYIPTPKDNEKSNNVLLHIPNVLVCLLAVGAIVYGLNRDWNPYNFIAAGFASATVFMLSLVILASQQLFLQRIKMVIRKHASMRHSVHSLRTLKDNFLSFLYSLLRANAPVLLAAATVATCLLFAFANKYQEYTARVNKTALNTGGFYTGVYLPDADQKISIPGITRFSEAIKTPISIVSIYQAWSGDSTGEFPIQQMNSIASQGSSPMITWEPWSGQFPANKAWPQLKEEKKVMAAISAGVFDNYIHDYAIKARAFARPLFIRFAQEPGNPAYPWSKSGDNTASDYRKAWQHIVKIFSGEAAGNVTWVWNPWQAVDMMDYYPGSEYVDWAGITCLNYGHASFDGKWQSFETIYQPYRQQLLWLNKPVMLAEFGSTNYGGSGAGWLSQSINTIGEDYAEIRSIVFFNTSRDKNWITGWRPLAGNGAIDWTISKPGALATSLQLFSKTGLADNSKLNPAIIPVQHNINKNNMAIFTPGSGDKPFLIKGILFNTGAGWQDGHLPLTMNQLNKDFSAIVATGCNTISRPAPSVYDRNIFKAAQNHGLKVIYGFWFDPAVDYFKDSVQVDRYKEMVAEKVKQYQTREALLAWCIGSQTSTELGRHFSQPYLDLVRHGYLRMIENIAESVHRLDSIHPVITTVQNTLQLSSELQALHNIAPSVDITGITSSGKHSFADMATVLSRYNADKPWLLTAFGPQYSNDNSFNTDDVLDEGNDSFKAGSYISQWQNNILSKPGGNLGGIAFCWQDNFGTTLTAWGLTDFKGRKKPAYYALKKEWTGTGASQAIPAPFLVGPDFSLLPGLYYKYTAIVDSSAFNKPEWRLLREDRVEEINNLTPAGKMNEIWIKVPDYGRYRLYLYLHDDKGNVITASIPIKAIKDLL